MHLFIRLYINRVVRRVILLHVVPIIVGHVCITQGYAYRHADKSTNEDLKCTEHDPRRVYPYCMMSNFTLWCDQSDYIKMPTPDAINRNIIGDDCQTSKVLYMNDSCLEDVTEGDMKDFPYAQIIIFKANKISRLNSGTFVHNKQLVVLDICVNKISEVDKAAFQGLHKLTHLSLARNQIRELYDRTLYPFTRLEELNLDENLLIEIDKGLFNRLGKLKVLRLRGNRIRHIHEHAMRGLRSLTHLHLDGNRLEKLHKNTFIHMKHLGVLTLSHNELQKWPPSNGEILVNLHTLDLGSNLISEFTASHVVNMSKLQNLSLENNSLSHIEEDLFRSTLRLGHLNLGNNYIDDIPKGTFSHLCYLRILMINSNRLKIPRSTWFQTMTTTQEKKFVINVDKNNWECGCQSIEYWVYITDLKSTGQETYIDVQCEFPKKFKGRKLSDIYEFELDPESCAQTNSTNPTNSTPTTVSMSQQETTSQESYALTPNCTKPDFKIEEMQPRYKASKRRVPKKEKADQPSDRNVHIVIVCMTGVIVLLLAAIVWRKRLIVRKYPTRQHSRQDESIVKCPEKEADDIA